MHTSPFQTSLNHQFVGTFNRATANRPALSLKGGILHVGLSFFQISQVFSDKGLTGIGLGQSLQFHQHLSRPLVFEGMKLLTQPLIASTDELTNLTKSLGGVGKVENADRIRPVGIKHGPVRDAALTLKVMAEEKVTGLVGLPTHVLALARHGETHPPLRLKSILLTADHVPEAIKTVAERAWSCQVYNHYGMTEMGLGGGVECQARRGYHLREADLYVEIVDPNTGQPVAEGETGEIVFTTLTRRGMPLIRYRTGDLSRFIPGNCPCGTVLKTLARVKNRLNGCVKVGDSGHLTLADLDEALFPLEGILNFSAAVTNEAGKDCLRLDVKVVETGAYNLAPAIQQALDAVPAIRLARQANQLDLLLEESPSTASSNPAKRIILTPNKTQAHLTKLAGKAQ